MHGPDRFRGPAILEGMNLLPITDSVSKAAATCGRTEPRRKRRRQRDLTKAITLRPFDVFTLYGIPTATLCQMCRHPNPERRLPAILIPGRQGRRGIRLVNHEELKRWLAKWQTSEGKPAEAAVRPAA